MKGLFSVVGLIAALFVSNVQASIYDTASWHLPEVNTFNFVSNCPKLTDIDNDVNCKKYSNPSDFLSQVPEVENKCAGKDWVVTNVIYPEEWRGFDYTSSVSSQLDVCHDSGAGDVYKRLSAIYYTFEKTATTCPPDDKPLYIFGVDSDDDGEDDKCYNPDELANASGCASDFNSGKMLTAGAGSPSTVCHTKPDGGKCGYSLSSSGSASFYQGNLEVSCFGDGDEIPPYDDPESNMPQPDQCQPYAGGFACAADPTERCNSQGACDNGCGYVNDQFICFTDEECTGADCDSKPVDCDTVPDAPVCNEKPPVDCSVNPSDPACNNPNPEPCTGDDCPPTGGGGGGSDFVLDYDRLGNLMKEAANVLVDDAEIDDGQAIKTQIEEGAEKTQSELDDFLNNSVFDEIIAIPNQSIFSGMESMIPSGSACSPISFGEHLTIDMCRGADFMRPILYFLVAFMTLIYLKNLLFVTIRATGAQ